MAVHGVYGGRVDAEAIDDDGGLRGSESTNECAREPNDGRAMSRHRAPRVVVRSGAGDREQPRQPFSAQEWVLVAAGAIVTPRNLPAV